ncbi:hypothetical protein NIES4072_72540 [Nostoc commune NIES-4072]|uniref:Uncharacterized protein n=1 Tax=Nostoc commune NIES-4072 TaxID=2005467 RepID=A0A2R5FXQ8_NOSCO|nr:hypothetical protein [Nostoc commune]BBD70013.1 hypothetical protein NIES4070_64240 [Nostoc commune HK-02]GBG23542.1 hypothetical protein NIES4072_72540 [Nostoc commune NIES-4072]
MTTQTTNINLDSPSLVLDTIFVWKGAGHELQQSNPKYWESICHLRIYQAYSMPSIILCSDLDEQNTGTSITNSAEGLATLIWRRYQNTMLSARRCLGDNFLFIEHYPRNKISKNEEPEDFSLVQFNWDGQRFSQPRWSPLTPNIVLALIQQHKVKD